MKKLFILFVGISLLTSCSKDDDNNPINGSIEGSWNLTRLQTEMSISEGLIKSVGEGKDYNAFMKFTDEPNQVTSGGSVGLVQKVYMNGTLLSTDEETIDFNNYFGEGQWQLSGNNLILSGQNSEVSVTITKLTGNSLVFRYNPNPETKIIFEFKK